MSTSTSKSMTAIPGSVVRRIVVRVLIVLVVVASVLFAWSGMNRLSPVESLLREKDSERAGLAIEIQQLENQSDVEEVKRVDARFLEAGERLFAGPEERDLMLQNLKSQAESLFYVAAVEVSTPQPHPTLAEKLTLHRATIDFQPAPGGRPTQSAYERLLSLVKSLQNGNRRVDVIELTVVGGPNSVRNARLILDLWSQEPK